MKIKELVTELYGKGSIEKIKKYHRDAEDAADAKVDRNPTMGINKVHSLLNKGRKHAASADRADDLRDKRDALARRRR